MSEQKRRLMQGTTAAISGSNGSSGLGLLTFSWIMERTFDAGERMS